MTPSSLRPTRPWPTRSGSLLCEARRFPVFRSISLFAYDPAASVRFYAGLGFMPTPITVENSNWRPTAVANGWQTLVFATAPETVGRPRVAHGRTGLDESPLGLVCPPEVAAAHDPSVPLTDPDGRRVVVLPERSTTGGGPSHGLLFWITRPDAFCQHCVALERTAHGAILTRRTFPKVSIAHGWSGRGNIQFTRDGRSFDDPSVIDTLTAALTPLAGVDNYPTEDDFAANASYVVAIAAPSPIPDVYAPVTRIKPCLAGIPDEIRQYLYYT